MSLSTLEERTLVAAADNPQEGVKMMKLMLSAMRVPQQVNLLYMRNTPKGDLCVLFADHAVCIEDCATFAPIRELPYEAITADSMVSIVNGMYDSI